MKFVTVRFLQPNSIFGAIASWRIVEPYGHAVIVFDGRVYNAIPPKVTTHGLDTKQVSFPPRMGIDMQMTVTDEQFETMEAWCASQVGKWYDLWSVVGWFFYAKRLSWKKNFYCFEFCRQAFVEGGLIAESNDLITSERLMLDLHRSFADEHLL